MTQVVSLPDYVVRAINKGELTQHTVAVEYGPNALLKAIEEGQVRVSQN